MPPGIADATVPNRLFNLAPAATLDEGNNWVNISWGPLSMTNPTVVGGTNGNYGGGNPLGNYGIASGSSAAGRIGQGSANYLDAPAYDFFDKPRKPAAVDAGAVQRSGGGVIGSEFTLSPSALDFGLVPDRSPTTLDQDVQVINSDLVPVLFNPASATITGAKAAQFSIQSNTCAGTTLAAGESCVINVIFIPNATQGVRNATLNVTAVSGATQTVSLTAHDTVATISVSPITPAGVLTPTPASTVAVTGTVTLTNTIALTNANAGPFVPTAITVTRVSGTGTFALGGTCAVGTPVSPQTNCTITVTHTPPAGATGAALNSTAFITVTDIGTASATPLRIPTNGTFTAN